MARRSADAGTNGKAGLRRSDQFLAGLKEADTVSFVSHVHPDPDSLGSMVGLAYLVDACLGKPTRLTQDGCISRAENCVMVDVLGIDLTPVEAVSWRPADAVVMVDSQPCTGRHNLPPDVNIYGVIDHHQ